MSARNQLLSLIPDVDAWNRIPDNLAALQLAAAQELLDLRRPQVAVLDKRARESGIDRINTFDDLIPLLFSHTNYKSYPEAFINSGRWNMMNSWLQTMSSTKITGVDTSGIQDVDDWIARLRQAGHFVFASSGTSGKASFLNQTTEDHVRTGKGFLNQILWQIPSLIGSEKRPCYFSVPSTSPHRFSEVNHLIKDEIGLPGEIHFLTDIPGRATDSNRMGAMRVRIAEGTATPDEIVAFEAEGKAKAVAMAASVDAYYDSILANRKRPIFIKSMWQYLYGLAERGRAQGIADGDFHPDIALVVGGGLKGANLPPDFQESALRFLGITFEQVAQSYGMVEMQTPFPYSHEIGGYVVSPWVILLLLDKQGERLLNPRDGGVVEGRMAFLDLSIEGRWGGIISGDKITVDFTPRAGMNGPFITSIARYKDLSEGDEKLNCAGTIDSYVKGAMND